MAFTVCHLSADKQHWQRGQSFDDFSHAYTNAPNYGKQSVILYDCYEECVDHAAVMANQRILQIVLTMRNVTGMQAKKWAAYP